MGERKGRVMGESTDAGEAHHIVLHWTNLVGCQIALASTAFPALLHHLPPHPGRGCLHSTAHHMQQLGLLGVLSRKDGLNNKLRLEMEIKSSS